MNKLRTLIKELSKSLEILLGGVATSLKALQKNLLTHLKTKKMKLIKAIFIALLIGMVSLGIWAQTAAKEDRIVIEKQEINDNSQKYQELQMNIDSCAALISDHQKEQQELSERNNLLRELFTPGKNQ